jgi:DNA-binding MurR/RpiR family transcriptional regulator
MQQYESILKSLNHLSQATNQIKETLRRVEKQLSVDIPPEDANITVNQFMKKFNVSRSTVERRKRELGFFKFNGKLYIKQSRIDEIEKNGGFDL